MARARSLHEQSLEIHRAMDNLTSIPWTLYFLGTVASRAGDKTAAQRYFEESLTAFRAVDDSEGIAFALYQTGMTQYRPDDPAPARALIEESLQIFRGLAQESGAAWTLGFLGKMATDAGDCTAARAHLDQSLEIWRRLGSRADIRATIQLLSAVALQENDWEDVRSFLRAAFDLRENSAECAPELLSGFLQLALAHGDHERAARLLGALSQHAPAAAALPKVQLATNTLREQLDAAVFAAQQQRGAELTSAELSAEVMAI